MKRKSITSLFKSYKKIKTENNENFYTVHNLLFPDRPSAIKENIYLHNFERLNKVEKLDMFKNIISQFYGWNILDDIEFYNKDYKYTCYDGEIEFE